MDQMKQPGGETSPLAGEVRAGDGGTGSPMISARELRVDGSAISYRLWDAAYAIDLERAATLFGPRGVARAVPLRGEAQALQIQNPPLHAELARDRVQVDGTLCDVLTSARIFDFGVCGLQLRVSAPAGLTWAEFSRFGAAVDASPALAAIFDRELQPLLARLAPAVERPGLAPVTESYVLYRVTRLADSDGNAVLPDVLTDEHVTPLLLNESRPLSLAARRKLLPHRFSYYRDDLAIVTWENALVVDPRAEDRDIEYVLEFANAQLLELRVYDALLDAELPAMYDRVAAARRRRRPLPTRRFQPVLADLQTRVADVTETVERAENALKVTDDVYLADVYAAALELFRSPAWRRGIERKLTIFRETYEMLNAEAHAARAELLEIIVVLLILTEILLSIFGLHA
jgi:hypothetical protein